MSLPRKPYPGDQPDFSARTVADEIDAVESLREGQLDTSIKPGDLKNVGKGTISLGTNNTGDSVPWYGVVHLGNPSSNNLFIDQSVPDGLRKNIFKQRVHMKAELSGGSTFETLGIAQRPCREGTVGKFLVDGVTQCRIKYTSEEEYHLDRATGDDGEVDHLVPNSGGQAEIIWQEFVDWNNSTGDETAWALVRFGGSNSVPYVYFKLNEFLSYAGSGVEAYRVFWNPITGVYDDPEDDTIDVSNLRIDDPDFPIRKWAGPVGTFGVALAKKTATGQVYEVVELFNKARFINFELTAALTVASAAADVDDFWDGINPDPDDEGITVYNRVASTGWIFEGDSGDKGIAVYDDQEDKYRIIQIECP